MIVRRLEIGDELAFQRACREWTDSSFEFFLGYTPEMSFKDYLELKNANEKGERLDIGFVPDTFLCGFVDGVIIGRVSVRHELSKYLMQVGGHIGYAVIEPYRNRGYAKQMLRESLKIARSLGIDRVLMTCDDDNMASIKTIESAHAKLENKIELIDRSVPKRRYWVELSSEY